MIHVLQVHQLLLAHPELLLLLLLVVLLLGPQCSDGNVLVLQALQLLLLLLLALV